MFTVFAVGGKNDGLELGNFIDEEDLICTGTAVVDENNNVVDW